MRHVVLCAFLFAVAAVVLAPGAAADQHRSSCPTGTPPIPSAVRSGNEAVPSDRRRPERHACAVHGKRDRRERRRHLLPQGHLESPRFQRQELGIPLRGTGQRQRRQLDGEQTGRQSQASPRRRVTPRRGSRQWRLAGIYPAGATGFELHPAVWRRLEGDPRGRPRPFQGVPGRLRSCEVTSVGQWFGQ